MSNCVVSQNGSDEIFDYCTIKAGGNSVIQNSIIWGNNSENFDIEISDELLVQYSIIEGGQNNAFSSPENLSWGEGNLTTDPLFTDATNNDFSLSASSCGAITSPSQVMGPGMKNSSPTLGTGSGQRPI